MSRSRSFILKQGTSQWQKFLNLESVRVAFGFWTKGSADFCSLTVINLKNRLLIVKKKDWEFPNSFFSKERQK